jgi:hypothetical protein
MPAQPASPGKKVAQTEQLGTVVGRQSAGISTMTGGDPLMHSMGHYGKAGPPGMEMMPSRSAALPFRGTKMGRNIRKGGLSS